MRDNPNGVMLEGYFAKLVSLFQEKKDCQNGGLVGDTNTNHSSAGVFSSGFA